jgi:hypothetical protein
LARTPRIHLFQCVKRLEEGKGEEHGLVARPLENVVTGVKSLALLEPRRMGFRLLPGVRRSAIHLRGLALVGSEMLGEHTPQAAQALVEECRRLVSEGDFRYVDFDVIHREEPLCQALVALPAHSGVLAIPRGTTKRHWWIDFPVNPADYWQKFSSKSRYNLRWLTRRYPSTLRCFEREDEVEELLQAAAEVSRKSWQHQRVGVRVAVTAEAFDTWRWIARQGAMRCYVLSMQDRPVAFGLGLQWRGTYYYEETGFDGSLRAESPGRTQLVRMLDDMVARNCPERFDFGFADTDFKEFFGNRHTRSQIWMLVRDDFAGRMVRRVQWAKDGIYQAVHCGAKRVGLYGALEKVYEAAGLSWVPNR